MTLAYKRMEIVIFLLLCAYLTDAIVTQNRGSLLKGKIIAGRRLHRIEERPYVASLKKNNLHLVTATLISDKSLLTAASIIMEHQNRDQRYEGYTIVAGTNNLRYGGVFSPVMYMRAHPEYLKKPHIASPFNIAVVVVTHPFIYTESIRKALRPDITYEGNYAYLIGWGSENPKQQSLLAMEGVEYNLFLKEVSFEVLAYEDCRNWFDNQESVLFPRHLCARPNFMIGELFTGNAARGDISAPLVYNRTIIGIYTYRKYDNIYSPSLFTNVIDHNIFIAKSEAKAEKIRKNRVRSFMGARERQSKTIL